MSNHVTNLDDAHNFAAIACTLEGAGQNIEAYLEALGSQIGFDDVKANAMMTRAREIMCAMYMESGILALYAADRANS